MNEYSWCEIHFVSILLSFHFALEALPLSAHPGSPHTLSFSETTSPSSDGWTENYQWETNCQARTKRPFR